MKRGTPRHPKTKALARALKIPVPHAAGILATLWDYVSDFCPDGGVGRLTDEEIADACGWPEKRASELISALTDERSRWLDRLDGCRLYIHDWQEHCEDTVHRKLARSGSFFADGSTPKLTRLTSQERAQAEKLYAQSAPDVRTACALPVPLPLPVPKPVPEPVSASELAQLGALSERMYARHPKPWGMDLVLPELERVFSKSGKSIQEIEDCHAAWCGTHNWTKENGHFAPKLPEWIRDMGFMKWPAGSAPTTPKQTKLVKVVKYQPLAPPGTPIEYEYTEVKI